MNRLDKAKQDLVGALTALRVPQDTVLRVEQIRSDTDSILIELALANSTLATALLAVVKQGESARLKEENRFKDWPILDNLNAAPTRAFRRIIECCNGDFSKEFNHYTLASAGFFRMGDQDPKGNKGLHFDQIMGRLYREDLIIRIKWNLYKLNPGAVDLFLRINE